MEKLFPKWPQMGQGRFFLSIPDLAAILGDMDFDFENFYSLDLLDPKFPDFQVPDFQISRNLAWASLGPWAGLGPSAGPGPGGPSEPPGGPKNVLRMNV